MGTQVQALVQRKARVLVKSGGLSPADLRAAWLEPVDDVSACVTQLADEYGPNTRVAILPEGPQTHHLVPQYGTDERRLAGARPD